MNCIDRTYSCNFYLDNEYEYIRDEPYDLNYIMIINERHLKRDSNLEPSKLVVRSVPSHIGKVGSILC